VSDDLKHKEYLIGRCAAEGAGRPDYFMHLQIPLPVLVSIVGHLQIALRMRAANPERYREYDREGRRMQASSRLVFDSIEQIIQRLRDDSFPYNAQFLAEGQPPRED
jgi:hypothetical protein